IGVVLEPALPVLVALDLAVAQQLEQLLYFDVGNGPPQPDAVDVVDRDEHGRLISHPQLIKAAGGTHDRLGFDALDYAQAMIRVDDLVANLKCHVTPGGVRKPRLRAGFPDGRTSSHHTGSRVVNQWKCRRINGLGLWLKR